MVPLMGLGQIKGLKLLSAINLAYACNMRFIVVLYMHVQLYHTGLLGSGILDL